jgi:hypothetical protein
LCSLRTGGVFRNENRGLHHITHVVCPVEGVRLGAFDVSVFVVEHARVWYDQHRLEEAKSEALRAAQVYEKLGAAKKAEGRNGS